MARTTPSLIARLIDRVFPAMPDFYGLINAQCGLVCEAMNLFVEFMETGDAEKGKQLRLMEKEGDAMKANQMAILNRSFATPMDREDIYRAIVTIDEVLNYAKTTVREMEALSVTPDHHMKAMTRVIRDGCLSLESGYRKLSTAPLEAEAFADAAHKAERKTEKMYRAALAELFRTDRQLEALRQGADDAGAAALLHVMEVFKRREIYRHLSNAADRLEHAAGVLEDIAVQIA
jgi:uncharacterized protein Yka (UPF0111/DUF47 family)